MIHEAIRTGQERGFSLIEVIIALALLAAVLLTISGLFIQGSQSVNSGRDLTEATSLATNILEDMDKWAFTQLYTNYCGTTASGALTFTTDNLQTNGTTCSAITTTASGWQNGIRQRLPNSKGTVVVTPMGGATFAAAKGVRVQVTVSWYMRARTSSNPRQVSLETVRF